MHPQTPHVSEEQSGLEQAGTASRKETRVLRQSAGALWCVARLPDTDGPASYSTDLQIVLMHMIINIYHAIPNYGSVPMQTTVSLAPSLPKRFLFNLLWPSRRTNPLQSAKPQTCFSSSWDFPLIPSF